MRHPPLLVRCATWITVLVILGIGPVGVVSQHAHEGGKSQGATERLGEVHGEQGEFVALPSVTSQMHCPARPHSTTGFDFDLLAEQELRPGNLWSRCGLAAARHRVASARSTLIGVVELRI